MKAIPINVEIINNSQVNITFQIIADDGSILIQATRGFTSLSNDSKAVQQDIIQIFKNARDSAIQQKQGVLWDVAMKLLKQEIDIA